MKRESGDMKISRRYLLRSAGLAVGAGALGALAGCASATSLPSTSTPTAPAEATVAPTAPAEATVAPTVPQAVTTSVTLTIAVYAEPSRTPVQEAMWKSFQEEHPDIKLAVQSADFNTYYTKLNANIAAETLPDVFMMSGAYFYNGAMKGVFKQLDSYIKAANMNLDDYFTEQPNMYYQGNIYAFPGEIDVMALAYNKTMFDEAGVKYPTNDWTWDDLLSAAQKLTRKNAQGQQTYGMYAVNNAQEMWGDLVKENGGSFLTPDLKQGALNSPEAIEAIQFAVDMIYKHKVSPSPQGVSSLPGYIESGGSPFLTGLVAMKFQGNYEMTLLSGIKNFAWDVVTMPKRKVKGGLGWTQAWVMPKNAKNPDKSWTLLNWLVTKGQEITASVPGRGLTPSYKKAAYSPAFLGTPPPDVKGWLDGWQYHHTFDFHPAWFEYQGAYSQALDAVFAGQQDAKSAMDDATKKVNEILSRYPDFKP